MRLRHPAAAALVGWLPRADKERVALHRQRNMQLTKAETSYKDMLFKHQGLIRQLQQELKSQRPAPPRADVSPPSHLPAAAAADSPSAQRSSPVGDRKKNLAVMDRMEEEMARLEARNLALEKRAAASDKAARDAERCPPVGAIVLSWARAPDSLECYHVVLWERDVHRWGRVLGGDRGRGGLTRCCGQGQGGA